MCHLESVLLNHAKTVYRQRQHTTGKSITGESYDRSWRQGWLTSDDQVRVNLKTGQRYPILIETDTEQQASPICCHRRRQSRRSRVI